MTAHARGDEPRFGVTRQGWRAIARASLIVVVLVAVYYTLPVGGLDDAPTLVRLALGVLALGWIVARQIHAIITSSTPMLRAIEAVAIILPIFILCVSGSYFIMSQSDSGAFSELLTRTDALYFTLSVFSTVGFGDISPVSQPARFAVTVQMFVDLILIGAGLRIVIRAVNIGRLHHHVQDGTSRTEPG